MTQQDGHSLPVVMSLAELLNRVDHDYELLGELVGIFKEEFPRQLKLLREQIARGDLKQVELTGHSLKGMLSGLSAKRAAETAARIERMGKEGTGTGLDEASEELGREFEELLPLLDNSMAGLDS